MKKKNLLMTAIAIFGLATITFAQTVPSYVPTNGLVGWWPFTGNANDESGNGNTGIITAATLTADRFGFSNNAYSIDGIDCPTPKGIIIPAIINNTGSYSISAWFKSDDSTKQFQTILNSSPHNYISCSVSYSSLPLCSWIGDGSSWIINGTNNFWSYNDQENWHNFILLKNTDSISYFLDGLFVHSQITTSSLNTGTFNLNFGAITVSGPVYCYEVFLGKLDDIAIWNRTLTQLEISALYNGCSASVTTQPINQSVNISNNAQFTTASSDPLATYQWQSDNGFGFQNLNSVGQYSGTANDTLTIANTTLSNNNQPFRCIVSSGSCTDTSTVAVLSVVNNTAINEASQSNLFSVYPNPANSQINVKADAKLLGSVYTIYDNKGKLILSGKINSENTVIDLGNLSGGIYLFSVGENLKQTFKVIKE